MSTFKGFDSVELRKPQRSAFNLSHTKRLTTRMGRITPILMLECVPSDTFKGGSEILLRLAPLLAPIYDQIELWVHYFFVPMRLIWDEWETFITGGRLGIGVDPTTAPVPPYFDIGTSMTADPLRFQKSSLADYLGVPDLVALDNVAANWSGKTLKASPWVAYHVIWYEYYRDRNFVSDDFFLNNPFPIPSGLQTDTDMAEYFVLRSRSYMHDYFTSALPFTQRGLSVTLPVSLGGNIPVYVDPGSPPTTNSFISVIEDGVAGNVQISTGIDGAATGLPGGGKFYIAGDDLQATSANINDFRAAYAMQVWLERNAVGGSRYNESTQAHFGVKPQDMRLQRPEYIGGGRIPVKISEVVSTAWSQDGASNDVPLANMGGHGVTYGNTNRFSYFCVEHGYIMGLCTIMNPPSYQQGLPRMFKRNSFLDYPWPTFAKLGEQTVQKYEIYCDPSSLVADSSGEFPVFGYQSRYADWKYMCSTNHGDFKDDLLFWTLTRTFATAPVLGEVFNKFQDDTQDRIFAVSGTDNFWMYIHNQVEVRRPLPYYGTPNTLGFH